MPLSKLSENHKINQRNEKDALFNNAVYIERVCVCVWLLVDLMH